MNFWSAVQVCVWIATRDERLVARVRPGASLFGEEERIAESSIYSVDLRLAVESAAAGHRNKNTRTNTLAKAGRAYAVAEGATARTVPSLRDETHANVSPLCPRTRTGFGETTMKR